jgi:CDP-diacylglycerol--glycerol-3-phosphate 3-phosphatidyltransferase
MEKSIVRTVLCYSAIQLIFISLFGPAQNISVLSITIYGGASVLLHILLGVFLIIFKKDFFNLSTGKQLGKINIANRITLLRISSLPSIAFLLHHNDIAKIRLILPFLLILVFLTDAFDGQIARRRKEITRMGSMLDSISDYSLLFVISIVYFRNNIVPHWFFYLIFFRLFLQAFGMFVFIALRKPIETKSTWGGKITIATTMTLYVIELVRLFLPDSYAPAFRAIEYVSGVTILILCFEKAHIFFRQGKKVSQGRKEPS